MSDDFKPEWVKAMRVALKRVVLNEGDTLWNRLDTSFVAIANADMDAIALAALRTIRDLLERDGWQVVPKVATREMMLKVAHASDQHAILCLGAPLPEDEVWDAMLVAAPSPWSAGDG